MNGQVRSINYTYDDLYRLTDEAIVDGVNGDRTSGYTYDNVGNRLTKTVNGVTTTYAYDGNDRLLNEKVGGVTTATYSYDNNGSTLTKTENGVTTAYTWNDEKRLVSATVGTQTVEYGYNDRGIRVSSKQNGVETRYLLNEGITANVWEEYAPNSTVQASYVYGNDLITQTQAGQTSYYLVDGLGSTRLLTDSAGQVLNAYGYEAFGQTVSQTGSTSNNYQYAGEQFDAALGDYYLRQRFYDMSNGRFGRMDTYEGQRGTPLTLNKYIYANSNPVMGVDPTGLFTLAEMETARNIRNILAEAQWDSGLELIQATDNGRFGIGDWISDMQSIGSDPGGFAFVSAIQGSYSALSGSGGGGAANVPQIVSASGNSQPEYVFRGDSRPPSVVFRDGFEGRDSTLNITMDNVREHVNDQPARNKVVSTSTNILVAKDYGAGNGQRYQQPQGWVYIIRNPGNGLDARDLTKNESEISFGRISTENIIAAKAVDTRTERFRGKIQKNFNFRR